MEVRKLSQEIKMKDWNNEIYSEGHPGTRAEIVGIKFFLGLGFYFIWALTFGIYASTTARTDKGCEGSNLKTASEANFFINIVNALLNVALAPALTYHMEKNLKKQTLIYSYYSKTDYRLKYIILTLRITRIGVIGAFLISYFGSIYAYITDETCSGLRGVTIFYIISCSFLSIITLFAWVSRIYEQQKLQRSAQLALKYYNVK